MDRMKEIEELELACRCLFISVDPEVAQHVTDKANAVISQLSAVTADLDRLREAAKPFVAMAAGLQSFDGHHDFLDIDIVGTIVGKEITAAEVRALAAAAKVQP